MKRQSFKQLASLVAILAAVFLFTAEASATPIGRLVLSSGAGGVTVGLGSIDWTAPAGPPNGAFTVGAGTSISSAVGSPAVGSTGFVLDLASGGGLPVPGFMTFPALPGLVFDLAAIGPGSANTNCAGLAIGGSCSIFAGSPIILTLNAGGTAATLSAALIGRDGTTPSNWTGSFTTQLAGRTPLDIQTQFGCVPGLGPLSCSHPEQTISSSYSAEFVAPEPASLELLGIGLASLALALRKKK